MARCFHARALRAFTGASRTPPGYPSPSPRRYGGASAVRECRPLRIGYASRPRLSSRLTLGGLAFPGTLGLTAAAFPTPLSLLMPASSLPRGPPRSPSASPPAGSSPTTKIVRRFGATLSPVNCRRMSTRPVSCYALFKCMAASKPTSWLSRQTHILCHSADLGALAGGLGCFPLEHTA